jgi:hypothetical protein
MAEKMATIPIKDDVPKVNGEIAVGENLSFQRKWWAFERVIWWIFSVLIICDCLGLFGQGWIAQAKASLPDGGLIVDYERIERASTPSTMTLHFGNAAIENGQVRVYVSSSVVKGLGAQRIAPQPAVSTLGANGITYTFPASGAPADVQIQLEPTAVGVHAFRIQAGHEPPINASVIVVP